MDTQVSEARLFCSQCGQATDAASVARFGDVLVCANCKPLYAQKLREGAFAGTVSNREPGGFWRRAAAACIDGLILFVFQLIVTVLFTLLFAVVYTGASNGADAAPALGVAVAYLIMFAGAAAYEGIMVHRFAATAGKMAMGLQVLRPDGSHLSLGRSFGRYFAKIVSSMTLLIGYLMAAFTDRKRALHDMICDTVVVKGN